jgi:DNA-binding Xre family transcriptional regulator
MQERVILLDKDLKKKDFVTLAGGCTDTVKKLTHGDNITTDVLQRIRKALDCDLGGGLRRTRPWKTTDISGEESKNERWSLQGAYCLEKGDGPSCLSSTEILSKDELYGLQVRRAAVSVPSNIAERQARKFTAEFVNSCQLCVVCLPKLKPSY